MKVRTIVFAASLLIFSELSWSQNSTDEVLNSDATQIGSIYAKILGFFVVAEDQPSKQEVDSAEEEKWQPQPSPGSDKDGE